jgi:hypothetical protein
MRTSIKTTSTGGLASAGQRRRPRWLLVLAAALTVALVLAATTQASSGIVGYFQLTIHRGESPVESPRDFAVPVASAVGASGAGGVSPGDIYVLDVGRGKGGRVQQFSASDGFIDLWGPGVVKSGPGNADETQAVRVDATSGAFQLGFGADTTADIPAAATAAQVQSALNGLGSIGPGGVSVSGGPGNAGGTSPYLVSFDGGSLAGADQPLLKATNGGSPLSGGGATLSAYATRQGGSGFEVCRPADGDECTASNGGVGLGGDLSSPADMVIDQASGNLYLSNRNRVEAYSAGGQLIRAWGGDAVAAGPDDSSVDEQQKVTVKATGGTFTLSFSPQFGQAAATAAPIPYNASAATVQAALNALGTISGAYGSVAVSGGPGDATGSSPYVVSFHGTLGGDDRHDNWPDRHRKVRHDRHGRRRRGV